MACPEVVVIYIYLQDFYNHFVNYNYTALYQDLDYLTSIKYRHVKVDDVESPNLISGNCNYPEEGSRDTA